MKRLATAFAVLAAALTALALPPFFATFESTYKVSSNSRLGRARCLICHLGSKGGKRNAYGKDVEAAIRAANENRVTAAVLRRIEKLDSSKSGSRNIDRIKADQLP